MGIAAALAALACFLTGCAGISSAAPHAANASNPAKVNVSLTPPAATVVAGGTLQFSAALSSTSNTAVTWKATLGTVSSSGVYIAPVVTSATRVIVTATSAADGTLGASSQVTVVPLTRLAIPAQTLPGGSTNTPYTASISASGGVAPYQWQLTGGALPPGLLLDSTTGTISGTATQSGTYSFTTSVTDSTSANASTSFSLAVAANVAGSNFDGPAELPRVYISSDMAYTPAPSSVIQVPKGGDFQQALNSVKCGQTIELQAGAVFTGIFSVPAQTCDDNHWIIVRTSASDSSLPPEGTRISPCYAGVASLPSRPSFHCVSPTNVLAKIQTASTGSGPLILQNGASHYRFIGLEITRTPSTPVVYDLVVNQKGATSDHIIIDRSWLHGTAQDETARGITMTGTRYFAVVDSYFSDFHCIAKTGACGDSQAIAGGLGSNPMGPFRIVNNFLEAAGENIIFGGGAATVTPADIEIRRNHMFKPLIWMQGQRGFVGGKDGNPFIVKNLFEVKNAQRILFDGNVLEGSWGGFSQVGFAILLTPKNQSLGSASVCPLCQVTDVTIRNVTISHTGGGMQIANGLSDSGGIPYAGLRYSIHDLIADDVNGQKYNGNGTFAQVSMGPKTPVLQDVTINHVTALQSGVLLNLGDDTTLNPKMKNFVFTNNIADAGPNVTQTTGGGTTNCAYYSVPLTALSACFNPYTFSHNAIIATPSNHPASQYPSGNFFPATASVVNFVNYNGGIGGDYHLIAASPYKNAATDGKDLGADIDAVESAIAGVK